MINLISFDEIFKIWSNDLWPSRSSKIESNSAMVYLGGYDIFNLNTKPSFFGYYKDDKLIAVGSGHQCTDNSYRIRGLYTFPEYRKQGIMYKIIEKLIEQATIENCDYVWAYPRTSSVSIFLKAGFIVSSLWEETETGNNAYVMRKL